MGRVAAKDNEVQTKPQSGDMVSAKELRDYYNKGAYSPAQVAEEFNVEEADVIRVLGLDKAPGDLDEFNQPKDAPKSDSPAE